MGTEAEDLAFNFMMCLRAELTHQQWEEMREKNRTVPENVCASHDYCDANVYMAIAFELTTGREPDPDSDADAELWSTAWNIAHRLYLTATEH